MLSRLDSFLRSPVTGKTTVTSTLESERTLIHQLMMLGLSIPCAFFTVPERHDPSVSRSSERYFGKVTVS